MIDMLRGARPQEGSSDSGNYGPGWLGRLYDDLRLRNHDHGATQDFGWTLRLEATEA